MKGETQARRRENNHLERDICIHIFSVSSAMVGVCLTVIGLIRVVITLGTADTLADDFLAADALLFLISCLLSYWALRSRGLGRMHQLERIADVTFIIAMIGMVVVCALITYTISIPPRRVTAQPVGWLLPQAYKLPSQCGGVGRGSGVGRGLGVGVGLAGDAAQTLKKIGS